LSLKAAAPSVVVVLPKDLVVLLIDDASVL
jgi:hypothetical protein